jgi:hypothetical protein
MRAGAGLHRQIPTSKEGVYQGPVPLPVPTPSTRTTPSPCNHSSVSPAKQISPIKLMADKQATWVSWLYFMWLKLDILFDYRVADD